jgi:hypothetical protein
MLGTMMLKVAPGLYKVNINIDVYVYHSFVGRLKRVYPYAVTINFRRLCISVEAYYSRSVRPSVCLSVCIKPRNIL